MAKIIEFHIIQSLPVNCVNRDDVGSPKSAIVGGVTRARVSSQCWKRAVRQTMHQISSSSTIKFGTRTKHLADLIAKACIANGKDNDTAQKFATAAASNISDNTLIFLSENEINLIASFCDENFTEEISDSKKAKATEKKQNKIIESIKKKIGSNICDALDIAIFGRMIAKAPFMDVEAASYFSHAISTHKANSEFDFFTAMDDLKDEDNQGSSHMGTNEFNSATYYRYIALDIDQLTKTLSLDNQSSENIKECIEVFIKALLIAIPMAKQHSQAAMCPWDYARILVRNGQCMQCSFETPVKKCLESGGGYSVPSINALNSFIDENQKKYGSMYQAITDIKFGNGINLTVDEMISKIKESV